MKSNKCIINSIAMHVEQMDIGIEMGGLNDDAKQLQPLQRFPLSTNPKNARREYIQTKC